MSEFDHLRALLVPLPSFQKARADYSAREGALADEIARDHNRAESDFLERFINPANPTFDMAASSQFVYLTPYSKHGNVYVPLLAVDADYTRTPLRPKVSVSILLYGEVATRVQCISYRFDVPNQTVGDHSFFHLQFAWGPWKNERKHRHAIDWISQTDPSIPLDATTPVEMLLSSIISFRNSHMEIKSVFDQWRQSGIPVRELMKDMALNRWKVGWAITPTALGS